MTKIKTLEEIQDLLINDFGIKNISGGPVITTNEEETSAIFSNTIPSIYYRAEIEYENYKNNADDNNPFDIPPQRDVRDAQPTISVNYRIIKNNNEIDYKKNKNSTDSEDFQEDWEINEYNDW